MSERPTVACTQWLPLLAFGLYFLAWPASATAAEGDRRDASGWIDEMSNRCASKRESPMLTYPSCVVSSLLNPSLENSWQVTLTVLSVFFAILVRQALHGFAERPVTMFVLFVIVLIGPIAYGRGNAGFGALVGGYLLHIVFSALAAGVLSFWMRLVWDLRRAVFAAAIGAAAIIVLRDEGILPPDWALEVLPLAIGVVAGAWLFWRGTKKGRTDDASSQDVSAQPAPVRGGGASSDEGRGAGPSSQSDDG